MKVGKAENIARKFDRERYIKEFKSYVYTTFGFLLVAASVELFMIPNKIAAGGTTGISIIINYFYPNISVGLLMLIMNIILFIVAFIFIGGNFGGKTIYASLALSGTMSVMDKFMKPEYVPTHNLLLATIIGTLIIGIGMGIVFNQNASTGGTDILAKILNKFFHLDMGKALLAVDFLVTIGCIASFGAEVGMVAVLSIIMNGFVIDAVIEGLNICKQIMVMSEKNDLISKYILEELSRGCTFLEGKGAYSGTNTLILYTVLNRREFIKLRNYIKEIDDKAFITVSDAHEVLGEGFKSILG